MVGSQTMTPKVGWNRVESGGTLRGVEDTANPSVNTDMLSPAFGLVIGLAFKITRNDDPQHTALQRTTCERIAKNPGQNGSQACALHATMAPEQHKKCMGKYSFSIITMS